jgi:hypothetical protein
VLLNEPFNNAALFTTSTPFFSDGKDDYFGTGVAPASPSLVPGAQGVETKGYQMKAMAIYLSSFREVLWLDSDNLALEDPAGLFESKLYQKHGAVLWPGRAVRQVAWGLLPLTFTHTHTHSPSGTLRHRHLQHGLPALGNLRRLWHASATQAPAAAPRYPLAHAGASTAPRRWLLHWLTSTGKRTIWPPQCPSGIPNEVETGQVLLDKQRVWPAIALVQREGGSSRRAAGISHVYIGSGKAGAGHEVGTSASRPSG